MKNNWLDLISYIKNTTKIIVALIPILFAFYNFYNFQILDGIISLLTGIFLSIVFMKGLIESFESVSVKLLFSFIGCLSLINWTSSTITILEDSPNNAKLLLESLDIKYCPYESRSTDFNIKIFNSLKEGLILKCLSQDNTDMLNLVVNANKSRLDPVTGIIFKINDEINIKEEATCLSMATRIKEMCPILFQIIN